MYTGIDVGKSEGSTKDAVICSLCDETADEKGEKIDRWCGGFAAYAHKSCMNIGMNAIRLYEKHILYTMKVLPEWQNQNNKKIA